MTLTHTTTSPFAREIIFEESETIEACRSVLGKELLVPDKMCDLFVNRNLLTFRKYGDLGKQTGN